MKHRAMGVGYRSSEWQNGNRHFKVDEAAGRIARTSHRVWLPSGLIEDAAIGFHNEAANAAGTIHVDDNALRGLKSVVTAHSGFANGYGPNTVVLTAVGTVDLTGINTVVFSLGASGNITTVTGAVTGRDYRFVFTNGNTTIQRGTSFKCYEAANLVGAAGMTTTFRAESPTLLAQASSAHAATKAKLSDPETQKSPPGDPSGRTCAEIARVGSRRPQRARRLDQDHTRRRAAELRICQVLGWRAQLR